MNGIKPNKENQRRFRLITEIGCIICHKYRGYYTPPQIHHIAGSKNQEAHRKTIGLCYWHHMADQQNPPSDEYVSRHPNKAAFEAKYDTESELLEYQDKLINEYQN